MRNSVESLLDKNGWGILTPALHEIFSCNGCEPECHLCAQYIVIGDTFRLRPMLKERPMKGKTDLLTVKLMVCKKCNSKPIPFSQIQRAAKAMEPSFDLVDNLDWERFYTIFKIDEPFEPRDPFTKKMRKIRASGGGGCFLIGDKIVANKEQQNV